MHFKILVLILIIDIKIAKANNIFLSCFFLAKDILKYNSFSTYSFSMLF